MLNFFLSPAVVDSNDTLSNIVEKCVKNSTSGAAILDNKLKVTQVSGRTHNKLTNVWPRCIVYIKASNKN